MFYCPSCKTFFDEPEVKGQDEHYEYWGRPVVETLFYDYCPNCGEDSFTEVEENEEDN